MIDIERFSDIVNLQFEFWFLTPNSRSRFKLFFTHFLSSDLLSFSDLASIRFLVFCRRTCTS